MTTEFKDVIGRILEVDSPVAFSNGSTLQIGFIEKFTPKVVHIRPSVEKKYGRKYFLKYPYDVVLLDKNAVTMYLLRR